MKNIILRIFAFTLALYISFLSVFNSFHVKVYAQALPELPPDFGSNFTVIDGLPGSSSPYFGLPSIAVEAALMKLAEPGGSYDGLVAHEDLALKIASDFVKEYGDDAFRVAVAQPAEAVQNLFWNYPNQAVQTCLDATNAGIVILADEYVSFSDALINRIKDFAQSHIINNVYYSSIPEGYFSNIYLCPNLNGTFVAGWTSLPQYRWLGPDSCRGAYHIIYKIPNQVDSFEILKIIPSNVDTTDLANWTYVAPFTSQMANGFFTDMPIFYTLPDLSQFEWWKEATNFIEIEPNIVTPVTNPIPIECPDIYHLPELYPWIGDVPVPSLNPDRDPDRDPDGYPIIEPDPIPIPDPAPVPVPQPFPDPDSNPDPGTDPDPDDPDPDDPDPDDPDPDKPDPDPDDPNPEDPDPEDPDPDKPDPDFDFPDDWGGSPLMDLSGFFPFCLPMDLYLAFTMLTAEAEPPVFEIPVNISLSGVNQSNYQDVIVIDIIQPAGQGSGSAEPYVKYLRFFLTFLFIVFLIFTSIKITPH